VDCVIGYFLARTTLRSLTDLRIFLILLAPGLFVTAVLIAAESLTHDYIVQPLFAALLGQADLLAASIGYNFRLGLLRAPGPFPHPILAGVFLGSFLSLYSFSALRGWPKIAGFVAACCAFFTISSAALLVLGAGLLATLYNQLSERIAMFTWRNFVIVGSIVFFVLELATQSGTYSLLVRFASFNSSSSFYRVLTWRYGSASVIENPVFGIGYAEYERPVWMVISSVDHYWLLLAIQYGLMPPLLILATVAYAVIRLGVKSGSHTIADRRLLRGTAIALAVFAMGAISVSLWQSTQVWFFMLLGIAVSLAIAAPPPVPTTEAET
jgi:O-antigen ligase